MRNIEDVIRRRQDELRGRRRNWRDGLREWWSRFDALAWLFNILMVAFMFAATSYFLLALLLMLAGCATTDNPCSMASMSAAQLERALVRGCGK